MWNIGFTSGPRLFASLFHPGHLGRNLPIVFTSLTTSLACNLPIFFTIRRGRDSFVFSNRCFRFTARRPTVGSPSSAAGNADDVSGVERHQPGASQQSYETWFRATGYGASVAEVEVTLGGEAMCRSHKNRDKRVSHPLNPIGGLSMTLSRLARASAFKQ